jgi:CRISPR/Cas system-associated protein Cas5 (RAMP superfamily)
VVQIDRGFAAQPPRCVAVLEGFRFSPDSTWIGALADGTGALKTFSECIGQMHDWIEDERAARGYSDEI